MLGIMNGKGRRGRPNREWIDNIKERCKKDLYGLTLSAQDQNCGNKRRNLHWTPMGFQSMDYEFMID